VQTRRLQESFEDSYSSLAYSSRELSRVIASYCSRQCETLILGVKWGFWAMTLVPDMLEGQARALSTRRLSSFQKKFQPKFWPIGLASRARQSWSKKRKHTHFASPS